jgi:hypothetical protein
MRVNADWAAVWVSVASFAMAGLALWRSGRIRVLDRRTELVRDVADLRLRFEEIERAIPFAVESRERVSAAIGRGGALDIFHKEAGADAAAVGKLQDQLNAIGRARPLVRYRTVETKLIAAREVRTRLELLSEKYARAAQQDEAMRQHLRDAAAARANRSLPAAK